MSIVRYNDRGLKGVASDRKAQRAAFAAMFARMPFAFMRAASGAAIKGHTHLLRSLLGSFTCASLSAAEFSWWSRGRGVKRRDSRRAQRGAQTVNREGCGARRAQRTIKSPDLPSATRLRPSSAVWALWWWIYGLLKEWWLASGSWQKRIFHGRDQPVRQRLATCAILVDPRSESTQQGPDFGHGARHALPR